MRNYLRGESYPPLDRLARIAAAADVSFAWLAAGEGPMRADTAEDGAFDWELHGVIVEGIERLIEEERRPMSGRMRGELIRAMYEYYEGRADQGDRLSAEDRAKIMDIIRTAMRAGVENGRQREEAESGGHP